MNKTNEAAAWSNYIREWLEVYIPSVCGSSPCTLKAHRVALSLYIHYLEDVMKVSVRTFSSSCFKRQNIERWLLWLGRERGNSPETCNNRLASIRVFLKFVYGKDVVHASLYNDSLLIPRRKTAKKKVHGMSKEAVEAILAAPSTTTIAGRRDRMLMTLMYATAARISEILSIKLGDVHLSEERPYILICGKGRKYRPLYLLPKVVTNLKAYMKEMHGSHPSQDAYLFYSRNNGIYGRLTEVAVNKQIKKHAEIARRTCGDVPENVHAHMFRHAKSSHWLKSGMSIVQISYLLGHSSINTTMRYLDITTEEEMEALATLEDEKTSNVPKRWHGKTRLLAAKMGVDVIR